MKHARLLTLLLVVMATALPVSIVSAQYPPPQGACTVTPPAPPYLTGQTVIFVVTALKNDGSPDAGLTGTVTVTGGTAAPTFTTDANGKANIAVTITASTTTVGAQVGVKVSCAGISGSSTISINTPQPKPPDTGFGTASEDDSFPFAWLFGGLAAMSAAGAAAYAVARSRK